MHVARQRHEFAAHWPDDRPGRQAQQRIQKVKARRRLRRNTHHRQQQAGTGIGSDDLPVAVDDDCRCRVVRLQDVFDGGMHQCQFRRVERRGRVAGRVPAAMNTSLQCSSGAPRAESRACKVPGLALARPVSRQLRWRCDTPANSESASWLSPACWRKWRRCWPAEVSGAGLCDGTDDDSCLDPYRP